MKHSNAADDPANRLEDWRNGGFGLYVHWPYCESKCPYCDFNSHVAQHIDHRAWRDAYVAEIKSWAEKTPGRVLTSIFFGGGTPSLMLPETVSAVIEAARGHWVASNSLEITLEANPASVEVAQFRAFSDAGVNRVSLGVQALNDTDLRRLGRRHDVKEALRAWDVANSVFDRTSLDLIYARQDQTAGSWKAELQQALALEPQHMSLYQLTIEEGTAFGDRHRMGKLQGLPSEDLGADLFEMTQEVCEHFDLPAYETSNHAARGEESRHNLIYWRYGDYVGVGPGAHGRLTLADGRWATVNESKPLSWLKAVQSGNGTHTEVAALSRSDQGQELLLMGMRLREGVSLARYQNLAGAPINEAALANLRDLGLIWKDHQTIGTTHQGRALLNSILRALV